MKKFPYLKLGPLEIPHNIWTKIVNFGHCVIVVAVRSSLDPAVTAAVWRFFFLGRKLRVFSCWPAQSSLVCWPAQSHSLSWFFWFAAAVWQDFSEKLRYFSCWLAQFILVCSAVQFSVDLCHRCSLTRFFLWQKSWEISAGDCLSSVSSQFQLIFPNEEARWINLHNHKSKFL